MPIDRETAVRTAEKFLRQGRLDGAIEQYARLVEEQPRDWNAINALGDLYVRAGDPDRAVAQFVRIADYLFSEGFLPKAAAVYKKALKARNNHEHTLFRLSEIAVQQGLLADGKQYLRQLVQQRQSRGDEKGAAECLVRLGAIDEEDGDAKVAAAKAAQAIGDIAGAVAMLQDAAAVYEQQGRPEQALDARVAVAELAPDNAELRADVVRALIAAGQLDRAQPFLDTAAAGDNPDLLLVIGRADLLAGRTVEAHATLMRVIALAPDRQVAVSRLVDELLDAGRQADAYSCVEILVDAALFENALDRAATTLESFLQRARTVPALIKLLDIYVELSRGDAEFDGRLAGAQAQLADALLDEGRANEARLIAEDLMSREPDVEAHVQRLRRALEALGVENIEAVIAERKEAAPTFGEPLDLPTEDFSTGDMTGPAVSAASPEAPVQNDQPFVAPVEELEPVRSNVEVDLSATLADLKIAAPILITAPSPEPSVDVPDTVATSVPRAEAQAPIPSLDSVFEQMRANVGRDEQAAEGATLLERAQEHLQQGLATEAAAALQAAARVPQLRFKAASQLGRLAVSKGDFRGGVEWLERAAAAVSPSMDETFAVMYELAEALEGMGEPVRALAVLIELQADAGTYRDVQERIAQLTPRALSAPDPAGDPS